MSESNETWLLKLCTLPLVGEWASTIVGLLPIILFGVFQGVMGVEIGFGPWVMLALTVLMIPWLMYLERSQGVRMNLPYVPVRLLWLMPLLIIYCVSEIVGA